MRVSVAREWRALQAIKGVLRHACGASGSVAQALFHLLIRLGGKLSGVGLLLGTFFFAASLTPSLIPRTYVMQGLLAGVSFAAGYGLGVAWRWLWAYLELPEPGAHL